MKIFIMIYCIDLDGTICEKRKLGQNYKNVVPLPGAIKKLKEIKEAGHTIIVFTARHMLSFGGDVEKIKRFQKQDTLDWLIKWEVPFDQLIFGKPFADIYIDDKALKVDSAKDWASVKVAKSKVTKLCR